MNLSESCQDATLLLQRIETLVEDLDRGIDELEVTLHDEPVMTKLVARLLECKRLSADLLQRSLPAVDKDEFAVGNVIRLAHDQLMRRARGAHTDLELYTKRKATRAQRQMVLRRAV